MEFRDRYASMKNRQAKDWWTITFGDPISWIILSAIGDYKWVTPIGITWLSFLAKIIPAGLMITNDRGAIIGAAILLQLGQVLDSMDGNLARYRGQPTLRGGFLDRVFDGTGFIFVMAGISWLAFETGSEPYYLIMGPMIYAFYLVICYVYWNIAYLEEKHIGSGHKIKPGNNVRSIVHIPTWKYILKGQKKLFTFHQADFYFWIGLGLILEILEIILWLLFVVLLFRVFQRIKSRARYLGLLDKDLIK